MHSKLISRLSRFSRPIIVVLLSIFILLIFFPLLLIILVPSLLVRTVVAKIVTLVYKSKIVVSTSSSHLSIGDNASLLIPYLLEGTPNIHQIREDFRNYILNAKNPSNDQLLYPELQQRVVTRWGYHFWEDCPNFNLCDHVKLLEGFDSLELDPQSGSPVLKNRCQALWSESPLWELLIIPHVITKDSTTPQFLLAFRFHHALCDTYSLLKLLDKIHTPEIIDKLVVPNYPRGFQQFFSLSVLPFKAAYDFATLAVELLPAVLKIQRENIITGRDDKLKFTNELSLAATDFLTIRELKEVAVRYGVTVNSVIIAILCGGLRRNQIMNNGIKTPEDLILNFPIPLPGHPSKLRNFATLGFIRLPLSEPSAEKRLLKIHRQIMWFKKSSIPWTVWKFTRLIGSQPPWILSKLISRASKSCCIALSNIPWSSEPVKMFGYPVKDVLPGVANCGGHGLVMTAFITYNKRGRLQQVADNGVLEQKESSRIIEAYSHELNELQNNPLKTVV